MELAGYQNIKQQIPANVTLVAVSKTKPVEDIQTLYHFGHRSFGENKAQELKMKFDVLPKDIAWHFIGHLQSNKIKYIAPFVALIHSIDSFKLLLEVNKEAVKNNRIIPCLLQFHIAQEDSKFGFFLEECEAMLNDAQFRLLTHINIVGVMGMATFTDNMAQIRKELQTLHHYFTVLKTNYFQYNQHFKEISMGMTDDFVVAIEEGSTMVRIGSAIFGSR